MNVITSAKHRGCILHMTEADLQMVVGDAHQHVSAAPLVALMVVGWTEPGVRLVYSRDDVLGAPKPGAFRMIANHDPAEAAVGALFDIPLTDRKGLGIVGATSEDGPFDIGIVISDGALEELRAGRAISMSGILVNIERALKYNRPIRNLTIDHLPQDQFNRVRIALDVSGGSITMDGSNHIDSR